MGSDNCFGCGESGHEVRYCQNVRGQRVIKNINQVVLDQKTQKGTTFRDSRLGFNKRVLPIW